MERDAFDGGSSFLIGIPGELDRREERTFKTTEATIECWYRSDLDSIHTDAGDGDIFTASRSVAVSSRPRRADDDDPFRSCR